MYKIYSSNKKKVTLIDKTREEITKNILRITVY